MLYVVFTGQKVTYVLQYKNRAPVKEKSIYYVRSTGLNYFSIESPYEPKHLSKRARVVVVVEG